MQREVIIAKLGEYQSKWKSESNTTKRFINFLLANPDCFERNLKIGHVTGSAWLVNSKGTHVLLTHHRRLNKWLQLGGHADGNPNVLHVALREVNEESGLKDLEPLSEEIFDIDIHRIPKRGNEPEHDHYDVRFAMQTVGSETYVVIDESYNLGWIRIEDLAQVTDEESMMGKSEGFQNRSS